MTLKKRLSRLTGDELPGEPPSSSREGAIGDLRRRIDLIMSRRPERPAGPSLVVRGEPVDLRTVVKGEERETPHGVFYLVSDALHASRSHGSRMIGEITSLDMRAASVLANSPELENCDYSGGLFLDTETTGLAGGTGTFAFLIGVGWFEGDSFVTHQIFARDFSEERACLSFLREIAAEKEFLVTFNGKAFDVGLLTTRFIMNRLPDPLAPLPHLDLIYPSRRLLGHRLENNRLVTLESEVLGIRRDGDIPGHEIPQRYFDWLRRRDGRLMEDVFEHNRLDILSMATLTVHLAELVGKIPVTEERARGDTMAAARLLFDRGDAQGACRFLEFLMECEEQPLAREAGRFLSLIHKREGRWDEAVKIWEMQVQSDFLDTFAVEELAKWCEHGVRDLERASDLVARILGNSRVLPPLEREAFEYRLERLKRRLERKKRLEG